MNKKKTLRLLILVLGIYLIVSLVQQSVSLWRAEERIKMAQRKAEEARQENEKLVEELKYVQSEEFVEKEARDKLGLGKEGETIVVLPQDLIEKKVDKVKKEQEEQEKIPNWQQWKEVFWGNQGVIE